MLTRGVLYIATQERWIAEAAHSAAKLRKIHPELPIALFCDTPVKAEVFDKIVVANEIPESVPAHRWHKEFGQKLWFLPRSPFEQTLYLDSDVEVLKPLDSLFSILETSDLALAHQALDASLLSSVTDDTPMWKLRNPPLSQPPAKLEYRPANFFNAGVLLYRRSEASARFFAEWWSRWTVSSAGTIDQDTMNELLQEGYPESIGLNLTELDNKKLNVRPVMIRDLTEQERSEVVILHSRIEALNALIR